MEPKGKKIKRRDLLPKLCSRCGNDLMTGFSIFHLPFEKRYVVFCAVCHNGLHLPNELFCGRTMTDEEMKKFWDEEVYGR